MFSEQELAFLSEQRLARLATVSSDGQPSADAVSFEFDGARFYIGGHNFQGSRKYKNVVAGNTKVSLIFDDVKSTQPWQPRGIKIFGSAEAVEHQGRFGSGMYLVITPRISWSWGIEAPLTMPPGKSFARKVIWD